MEDKKENKYIDRIANIVATGLAACGMAIVVALTIKLIAWLIF